MIVCKCYWLMKFELDVFFIDDLVKVKVEFWNGVCNYQVCNFMCDGMQVGDGILFYYFNIKVFGIVGLVIVVSLVYLDDIQFDLEFDYYDFKSICENLCWMLVDVVFDCKFKQVIVLDEIKLYVDELGEGFLLVVKGNCLLVFLVIVVQWKLLLLLEKKF